MQPYDIFNADLQWKNCSDIRPYLIIEILGGVQFNCFAIASEAYAEDAYFIDKAHPDFAATGLTKSCHVHYVSFIPVKKDQFTKQRGKLVGELLNDFKDRAGL